MTYQIVRFLFFIVTITFLFEFSEKYIVQLTKYILLEGDENRERKKVNQNKNIEIAKLTFHFIGFGIMICALIPIRNYSGSVSFEFWDIVSFITALSIFFLGTGTFLFTWSDKFKFKLITVREKSFIAEEPQLKNDINSQMDNNEVIDDVQTINADIPKIVDVDENNQIVFKEDLDYNAITELDVTKNIIAEESIKDFELLLANKKPNNKISLDGLSSKNKYEYSSIFPLLDKYVKGGLFSSSDNTKQELLRKKEIVRFICENFLRINEEFASSNVSKRCGEWKKTL